MVVSFDTAQVWLLEARRLGQGASPEGLMASLRCAQGRLFRTRLPKGSGRENAKAAESSAAFLRDGIRTLAM